MKNATFKTTARWELTDEFDILELVSDTGGVFTAQVKDDKLVGLTQRVSVAYDNNKADRWVGKNQRVFWRVAEHVAAV